MFNCIYNKASIVANGYYAILEQRSIVVYNLMYVVYNNIKE